MTDVGTTAMTILLVEDEPYLRRALARSLGARGHRVDEAGNRAEAGAALAAAAYDLLLLDVNLPDATGWDVLRDLRAAGRRVPSIVLSAVAPNPHRVKEFAPVGILHKPFPLEALVRLVDRVAEGQGSRHRAHGPPDDRSP